jgi:hypothetical protein
MLDIHLVHVRGAEEVLLALRDPNIVLEKVARLVGQVPPLAERLRVAATDRAQRPVKSGEQAVLMLGCTCVEQETRALVTEWLEAMERGGARIVPFPARTPSPTLPARPTPVGGWRRAGRGA